VASYVDLEIGLHRRDGETWTVELQCTRPDEDVDVRLVRDGPRFDLDDLRRSATDDLAYGRLLTESLFAVPDVRQLFATARVAAESWELPLRMRLFIGPSAPELHDVRWETLRDPGNGASLLTNESVLFSRYLSSLDWRPAGVRPKAGLRALVVIANPSDLASYRPNGRELAPIPVDAELTMIRAALDPVGPTVLASSGSATLDGLVDALRDGYDVVVLMCHGYLVHREPQLLLETATGTAARVPGSALVERLRDLPRMPRLVVLASCQSAGAGEGLPGGGDDGTLAALGPRLAEVGVPAVVAMQGSISMRTMDRFVPTLFRELRRDGQIDRAMAVARGAVRQRPDWWMPVLFMRLKSGRIWYSPGFAADTFDQWPALFADIRQGRCTPVLGPGLSDALLGTRQEIAWRWASAYHFPLDPHDRHDLAHVAQYLAIRLNYRFPRESLVEHLRTELIERYQLPGELQDASLDELVKAAGERRRMADPAEPHVALAGLPFPLYVTADPSDLLVPALVIQGKQPSVELCRWSEEVEWPQSVYDLMPDYRPDVRHPLVYHLLGHLRHPDTVALTLDDYQDFLIGVTSNRELIPAVVRRALSDTALLFLGFRMDQQDFRVLFRSIMRQEGRSRRTRYSHVAVQIDPEESSTLEPERARRYMEKYFGGADISIYWGSVESFVRDLQRGLEPQLR
jgi:hypothetical protein